jgi:aliphatic sulfonates family ABC transporter substrate-binding protein
MPICCCGACVSYERGSGYVSKRILVTTIAAAVFAFAVIGFPTTSQAKTKIRIGTSSGFNQLPSLVALEKGFFRQEGLDVELKTAARGAIAIEALTAGTLEFAASAHIPFMAVTARGAPLVAVAVIARGSYGKLVASPRLKDLNTFQAFKGKRIGVQLGTGVHTVLLMILEREGLTEQDLGITNLRVVDMPAAMASGSFDAVVGWEPMMQRTTQRGYGVQVIGEREFDGLAGVTFPFLLSVRQEYRDKNSHIVQATVNAYAKAHQFIRSNPDEAIEILAAALNATGEPMENEIIRTVVFAAERFTTPAFTEADWKDLRATAAFGHKRKQIEQMPDLGKIVDDSFGKKAATTVRE